MAEEAAGQVDGRQQVRDTLFQMEPDLLLLEGLVANLRSLGSSADAIDTSTLAALGHYAGQSLQAVRECWRTGVGG